MIAPTIQKLVAVSWWQLLYLLCAELIILRHGVLRSQYIAQRLVHHYTACTNSVIYFCIKTMPNTGTDSDAEGSRSNARTNNAWKDKRLDDAGEMRANIKFSSFLVLMMRTTKLLLVLQV